MTAKETVQKYYDSLASGDYATAMGLFADDIAWWVPPSSPMAGLYEGKQAVLGLFGKGTELYDPSVPMKIEILNLVAEDERCAAEIRITARTAKGKEYKNYYHFLFQCRDGKITGVKEYVDTLYAQRVLFEQPV